MILCNLGGARMSNKSPRALRRHAKPPRASQFVDTASQQRDVGGPSHEVAKSYGLRDWGHGLLLAGCPCSRTRLLGEAPRVAVRRVGTCAAPRGLPNCIKSSPTTSLTTLKRFEASGTVLVVSIIFFGRMFLLLSTFVLQNRISQSYGRV